MPTAEDRLSYYRNKTVLITGAAGYIASAVMKALKDVPCTILAADRQSPDLAFSPTAAKIKPLTTDIQREDIWETLLKGVDIVFHLAAQTSSKASDADPLRDARINLLPMIHMIDTCRKKDLHPQVIFSGTVTQAGFTDSYPVNEDHKDAPITVYDINKLAAEKYLAFYKRQGSKAAVTLRLANVYGPGPKSSSADRGILNAMVRRAVKGEAITIYGQGDFVRDYIYIDDVARAFLMAAEHSDSFKHDYYLIGSGRGTTIKEAFTLVRDLAAKKTGKKSDIVHQDLPEGISPIEQRNFAADSSRFRKACGWQPAIDLREGLEKTIEYYL